MRRLATSILLAGLTTLPALAQSHLNVAPGKFVQLFFTHKSGDPANVFSSIVQISNDGQTGSTFAIPFGQALVMTDISLQSYVPAGYAGTLDGFVSLRWYINNLQAFNTLYSESFKALGVGESFGLSRSFTTGRIFTYFAGHSPSFNVTTPWDPAFGSLSITVTGYLISYP